LFRQRAYSVTIEEHHIAYALPNKVFANKTLKTSPHLNTFHVFQVFL